MFGASKTASVSGGYQISRSLRFNSADTAYLNRTPASAGNRKTWTYSAWVKLSNLASSQVTILEQNTANTDAGFLAIEIVTDAQSNNIVIEGYNTVFRRTTASYRDYSAWYHIVVAVDTTQATANNRIRLYVNGVEVTAFGTTNNPTQNADTGVNSTGIGYIGLEAVGAKYSNAYMTEIYMVDGSQLTPSSFGETNAQTGVWQPKAYSGSYGTNGFYLNFSDNSNTTAATLGKDYSGNGNNWTPNNFSVTAGSDNDSMVDVPTPYGVDTGVGGTVRGNYCTLNPLDTNSTNIALLNGNLTCNQFSADSLTRGTFGVSSGKWYWEATLGNTKANVGIATSAASLNSYCGSDAFGFSYYSVTGQKINNGTLTSYGASSTTGDVIGIAFDADAGTLTFYKNNTSQGTAFTGLTSGPYFPAQGTSASLQYFNFGQRPFAYTAPSGFKALCTQNLPTPTIGATTATQAGKYFNTILWSGNGGGTRSLTGVGFQPSFVWAKTRNSSAQYHTLFDAVRGGNKTLFSNSTLAENTNSASGYISSFDSDGFSVIGGNDTNASGSTYVGWNWSGNGTGSTNTSGSITSTVSANTTSGFSIATWTGITGSATVGHGLGVAPAMVIYKSRSGASSWVVLHQSLTNMSNYWLKLNTADAELSGIALSANPTSSVIYTNNNIFANGDSVVTYCFAEIAGYSKISSYTGNGSADGVFVYCGFRPAYVMIKETAAGYDWVVEDSARDPYNVSQTILSPNNANADATGSNYYIDFLSNGFKIRSSYAGINANGVKNIFAAFATSPFKYSLAR
jgi:hypothetical protein